MLGFPGILSMSYGARLLNSQLSYIPGITLNKSLNLFMLQFPHWDGKK